MRLEYAGIELKVLHVAGYQRKAIYDGPDYLYTRYTIHVRGYFNPSATSYHRPNVPGEPIGAVDQFATVTDVAIRHRLLQPRQQLFFWNDHGTDNLIQYALISPQPVDPDDPEGDHYATDANNGPFPLDCNVAQVIGTKTFMVDFVIQTDINECGLQTMGPGKVLSHRWSMTDEIDDRFFTTRTIKGDLSLATNLLLQNDPDLTPDDFRRLIVHPVGRNMKRERVVVEEGADRNHLKYTIIDRELPINLDPKGSALGVVKIEAGHRAELGKPTAKFDDIVNASLMATGMVANVANVFDPTNTSGRFNNLASAIGAIPQFSLAYAPRFTHTVYAKVWGSRTSERKNLEQVAFTVIMTRLSLEEVFASAFKFVSFHLLTDKYVECSVNYTTGPLGGSVFRENNPIRVPMVNPQEDIAGVLTNAVVTNPELQHASKARGSFVQKLLTAALTESCERIDDTLPPTPPDAS